MRRVNEWVESLRSDLPSLRDSRRRRPLPRKHQRPRRLAVERFEDRTLPSFIAPLAYDAGFEPWSVAMGDVNGDGHLDLAVAYRGTAPFYSDGGVSVLLGNGDGTFQAARNFPVGSDPRSVAVGDFNGDGHLDLVVANSEGD